MADNPFDQFDAPESAGNPFDQFDEQAVAEPSTAEKLQRGIALTGRAAAEGVVGTLASPYDLPATAMNIVNQRLTPLLHKVQALRKIDEILASIGITGQMPTVGGALSDTLDRFGAPVPETDTERLGSRVVSGVTGALSGIGLGRSLATSTNRRISDAGTLLKSNPKAQVAGAVTGATAADVARQSGAGDTGQLVAGALGGSVPSLAASGAPAAVRGMLRGGEEGRRTLNENVNLFRSLGTEGTIGDVSPSRFAKGSEAYLSRGITGSGPIERQLGAQDVAFGKAAESAAESVSKNIDETKAGLAIERGLRGFVETAKDKQKQLYGQVDRFVSDTDRVPVTNVKSSLDEMHVDIKGAPNQSRVLRDPMVERLRNAIKSDTEGFESVRNNPEYQHLFEGKSVDDITASLFGDISADGKTPYEALRRIRSFVGAAMAEPTLTRATRDNLSKVYGALSSDISEVVNSKGPEAVKAFNNANNFTRGLMRRMELVDTAIDRNGGPEKVFAAAVSGTKEGATVINAVMKSLPQEGRDAVSAMMLDKLGRGTARKFDIEKFTTNWENISPRAKATLFANLNPTAKEFIASISKVVDIKKQGSHAFGGDRPGGSSWVQQGQIGAGLLAGLSLAGGNVVPAVGYGALMAGQGAAGKAMVNPNALRFLGQKSAPIHMGPSAQISLLENQLQQQRYDNRLAKRR